MKIGFDLLYLRLNLFLTKLDILQKYSILKRKDVLGYMSTLKNFQPIHVIHDDNITSSQLEPVIDGLRNINSFLGANHKLPVDEIGVWRLDPFIKNSVLIPKRSIDWYIQEAKDRSPDPEQINVSYFLSELKSNDWQNFFPYYKLFVVSSDLNIGSDDEWVFGGAIKNIGTIISVSRFLHLSESLRNECIKTLTMHETGHILGLPAEDRVAMKKYLYGWHCTNKCIMRQGLEIEDWIEMTVERQQLGPFCNICLQDLLLKKLSSITL